MKDKVFNFFGNDILYKLLIIVTCIVALLFNTQCSPFFAMSTSIDANNMFTCGKNIVMGLVPYVDFFEQHGPLQFLTNSFAYLISARTLFGVYLAEVINLVLFSLSVYGICKVYMSVPKATVISLILSVVFVCSLVC